MEMLVATSRGSGGILTGRQQNLVIVAVVALGSLVFVAWLFLFGGIWRSEVSVEEAELRSSDLLALVVASCNGDPEVSLLRETDQQVQVRVVASSTPLRGGGDCLDVVEVQLQEPLNDRVLVDLHSGQSISVTRIINP
ncbi:MAG TPA: hypothetical protein VFL72_05450 [Acidimicrobiia bacterium]|nr:hypothetical protein [Acidimicrobiia bacterium]